MIKLTEYEKKMLNGDMGRFKQVALENIVKYAEALDAEELCEVTKATIFMGAHPYLEAAGSDDYNKVFSKMHLCKEETIEMERFDDSCWSQSCVCPCDLNKWEELNVAKKDFDKNLEYLNFTRELGVHIVGSCTPYLTGWIPLMGEHFVTTESSNVLFSNAVFGACGNSDGIEAASWSAICGRTPKWGNHIRENRAGTHIFNIECPSETAVDWDVIGLSIGRLLPPHSVPVINGAFKRPDLIKLKQCFASMATTSGAEMCHVVGITPEAVNLDMAMGGNEPAGIIDITEDIFNETLNMLCNEGEGDVQFVTLGCPHYTLEEIKDVAMYIRGKKVDEKVNLMVWTDYSTKSMSDLNGYTEIIQNSGGDIYTSSCPLMIGPKSHEGVTGMAMDGAKQAHYIKSETEARVFYGSMEKCIDAAVKGR